MKETIKKIHLYSGLSLFAFMVIYYFSGFVMINHSLFTEADPVEKVRSESFSWNGPVDSLAISAYIQEHYGLRGKRQPPRRLNDGRTRYNFYHPGVATEAMVSADRRSVEITVSDGGFRGMMVGFHRILGYFGGWLYVLWSFFYDAASAASIVFAVSGIVIWYSGRSRDKLGWLCLGTGFGLTLVVILYLMLMP
ncbi:MAG: PepSY-associated TM helix domain-containing protein [Candidatus Glassbacteria bacterium]